jgi:exosortase
LSKAAGFSIQYARIRVQMDKQDTTGVLEEFQQELIAYWQRLPNKTFFFVLLTAWLGLFQFAGNSTFGFLDTSSLLSWMFAVYNHKTDFIDDSHALFVPLLVLGLFWWKRNELMRHPLQSWWPALLLVVLGLLLHVVGYRIQQPRISIVALFTGIYGLMGLTWGREWLRASFFPFFLFAFCVPFGTLTEPISFPLRILSSQCVEWISHYGLAIDVIREGTLLKDPTGKYSYEVAAACGGIRSLVAIFLLATVFGFVTFRSGWKRLFMMASAFPLAVAGNVLRMLTIVIAAEFWGQDAGMYVHESGFFSMIPYVPAIVGLIILGRLLETSESRPGGAVPKEKAHA